jgi:hypothetical protein
LFLFFQRFDFIVIIDSVQRKLPFIFSGKKKNKKINDQLALKKSQKTVKEKKRYKKKNNLCYLLKSLVD